MPAPKPEPLLDLDTLIERPCIKIDGQLHAIFSPDELSVIQNHRFVRWGERIRQLQQEEGEKAETELDALVERAARAVLVEIDEATFVKLSGAQKLAIIEVFTALLLRSAISAAGAMHRAAGTMPEIEHPATMLAAMTQRPTGAPSFPGSPGSTASTRESSWRRCLRFWFGA